MTSLWARAVCCSVLLWTLAMARSPPVSFPPPRPFYTSTKTAPPTTPPVGMTYWVTFSQNIHPGTSHAVSVYVANATGPVTLQLDLMDYDGKELQDGQEFTLPATGDIETIHWEISGNLRRQYSMFVRAQASGGLWFDGFQRAYLSDKRLSVFIQTDRTTYQPGQTVKFRALSMLADLQVTDNPMDIVITDPHNNRIAQWLGVKGDTSGVFEGEMMTSLYPPLGTWKIVVTVDGVSETKTFKLEEYELPQFEVKVKFPKYPLMTDKTVVGKVSAKYTFGSAVKGSGTIVATLQYYRQTPVSVVKSFKLNQEGEAEVTFTNEELIDLVFDTYNYWYPYEREYVNLNYKTFDLKVNVTDVFTDDVMTASTSLRFYDRAMSLRFTSTTPNAYKPGLPFTAYVEVVGPDWKPLQNPELTGTIVNFTVFYYRDRTDEDEYTTRYSWQRPPMTIKQTYRSVNIPVDENGVARLTISSVPESKSSVIIEATIGIATTTRYLYKYSSPSDTFLQLILLSKLPKVGKRLKVRARSNVPFSDFTYQVYAKGALVLAKTETRRNRRTRYAFSLTLTSAMAPICDVLVFFQTESGEVVADRLAVRVEDASENKVFVRFIKPEAKPGKGALLRVFAEPDSRIFLLGVDKSSRLMGTGNDITKEQITSELMEYGTGSWYYMNDADDVFRDADVGIITDGEIPGKNTDDVPWPFKKIVTTTFGMWMYDYYDYFSTGMSTPQTMVPSVASTIASAAPTSTQGATARPLETPARRPDTPAERLRKFFPETWLWYTISLRSMSSRSVSVKTPDTITTWVVTAFAVHPRLGLCVADAPAELLTIKRLFVTLDLPYSAVRGEDVCFTAVTFNRYPEAVNVSIYLRRNAAFQNTLVTRSKQNPNDVIEVRESRRVKNSLGVLQPNAMVSTVFCITPKTLGTIRLQVNLRSDKPADRLVKTIRIKPEGVERSQSYPVLMEITDSGPFSTTVDIAPPEGFVKGSLRISVSVVGDVLGPVVDNMEDLLKMPYGCGEQNMINFAPNTYLIDYLDKTDRLTPGILSKARSYMVKGYQRELTYQHYDGSFSAFGKWDKSGSIWLTAFVTKCFVQAAALGSDVITIEPSVVVKAVTWMTRYQNADGSFREPGHVHDQEMQGGSAEGVGLTAYITISLKEAENAFSEHLSDYTKIMVTSALSKAVLYLEEQLSNMGDNSYTACIVAYALALTGSAKAAAAREKMEELAVLGDAVKYWSGPVHTKQTYYSWYRKTDALSIEMTSYALLTLMHEGSLTDAIPVFRWLNKQRGPKGGFISTQDTVLGVEALAAMSDLALGSTFSPIHVQVSWNSHGLKTSSLSIEENSVLLLQKLELELYDDHYPDQITITATSNVTDRVFALAEVVLDYNMDSSTVEQAFSADLTVSNNSAKSFVLTTCVRRTQSAENASKSMVLAEIGVPSGYDVVRTKAQFGSASRVEYPEGQVVLYYYSLDTESDCSVITMKMSKGVVANSKPTPVRVYDYYSPDDEYTTHYSLKQFGVCDLEPDYMDCPFAK